MKERKFIIVRKLNKKEEFRSQELDHCKFVGIARASEEQVPQELKNERDIGAALSNGWRVLAVCTIPVPVPFVVLNVKAVNEDRTFNASGFISVRLTTGHDFYNWVMGVLTESDEVLDTDFWEVLYCQYGLDDYFKHLVNSENVVQLEKHNIHATDFPEFGERLRKWFSLESVDSFRVEPVGDEPSAALLRCINAVNKAKNREAARKETVAGIFRDGGTVMSRTWAKKFIDAMTNHPFRTLSTIAVVLLVVYFLRGCLSSYSKEKEAQDTIRGIKNAAAISEAAKKKPVKGSISVKCAGSGGNEAETLLVATAQSAARNFISDASGGAKAWRDGAKIEMPANSWAGVVTQLQKFAAESAGEFTCEVSGNDIKIVAHPEVVKSYTLDVDLLRTDAAAIGVVSKAFGVSFGGQTRLGPMPIRSAKRKAALKALDGTQVKVELGGDKSEIVFAPNLAALSRNDPSAAGMTDAELSKKADAFWRDVAAEKFSSIPKAYEDIRLRFSALDHEFTDGFEAAERDLAVLLDDIAQKKQECAVFLAECGAPWRQYSAAMPSDKNAKVRTVREAQNGLDALKKSAQARYDRVSFDKDIAQFKKEKSCVIDCAKDVVKIVSEQKERIDSLANLKTQMDAAISSKYYGALSGFKTRFVTADERCRANRSQEEETALRGKKVFEQDGFSRKVGSKWLAEMSQKHKAVQDVQRMLSQIYDDFSDELSRCFGVDSIIKAVEVGSSLSNRILANYSNKTAKSGTEAALFREIGDNLEKFEKQYRSDIAHVKPSMAGMSDSELRAEADVFWKDVAPGMFEAKSRICNEIKSRFLPYDHEYAEGFEEAEVALCKFISQTEIELKAVEEFEIECSAPWRQDSLNIPVDKLAKMQTLQEVKRGLSALRTSIEMRYNRLLLDKDIAQFKKNKEQFIFWSGEMIKVYNAQQARLAQISQLRQNMANALNARSFSQIAAFESSIADFENAQRANRTREVQIGQYVQSICSVNYFDQTFGQKWMKAIIRKYAAKVAGVDLLTQKTVADFSSDVQRLFGAATLDKALDHGRRLSEAVVDNHKEARDGKTLSEMGAEIALVCGLRNDLSVLKRAQRKFGQQ